MFYQKNKVRVDLDFAGDTVSISYYFDGKLVDKLLLPHANAVIDFIAKNTGLRENTVRRYIYKNKRDELVKNNLVTFENGQMEVLDIEKLINYLKKE